MSRTLYEIRQDFENCIDLETGEIDEQKWSELEGEWTEKVENVALYVKNQRMLVAGMTEEKKNLEDRIKSVQNQIDGLNQFLYRAIVEMGGADKFETPKAKVTFRKSESVDIVNEDMIPARFMDFKTVRKPLKKEIKEAIKNGEEVDGATISVKYNTQVK